MTQRRRTISHLWPLEDPKGQPVETVRAIRDEIRIRVQELVKRQGWAQH